MANTLQIRRGANANLPTLNAGEFGFSTDTKQVYIGDGAGNHELVRFGATDVSGASWVLDQDDLSGDDATKIPTQQSVKAYVDNASYVPLATSGNYSIPDGQCFIGGPEYEISSGDTLTINGSGAMVLVG